MKWLCALLISVAIGLAIYGGLQYYLQWNVLVSALVAVIGALYSAVVPALDLVKKWYEIRKLRLELREKEAAERLIQLPTAEEIRRLGKMTTERLTVEDTVRTASVEDERGFPRR